MWSKLIPGLKRWVSRYLVVTMMLSFVFSNSFAYSVFAEPEGGEGDTASASDAVRNGKVSFKGNAGTEQEVWIAVLSHEAGYEVGDEVCLDIYIKNNTDQELTDGVLKYKAKGILEDSGYFEEMDSLYADSSEDSLEGVLAGESSGEDETLLADNTAGQEALEKQFEEGARQGAPEKQPEEGAGQGAPEKQPEEGAGQGALEKQPEEGAEQGAPEKEPEEGAGQGALEKQPEEGAAQEAPENMPEDTAEEKSDGRDPGEDSSEEDAWWEDEDSPDDQPEDKLTDLTIGAGEVYHTQFYFTIDDSIETIKNQKVTFKFQGENEEGRRIFTNEDFYYGVGAMNLLPVESGTAGYFQNEDSEDVQGVIPAGAEGRMLLSFDLGDIEDKILDEILESGSRWEGASPSDGRPASDSQAQEEPANTASRSDAYGSASGSHTQTASSSQIEKGDSGTNPWIKWEGESFGTTKKERPIVRGLKCEVEAWGVKLNRFRKVNQTAEDEYDISSLSTFQIDPGTEPGVYYGKVTASYQVNGKAFRSSQGFILTVTEGVDEAVIRMIGLIDELPELEEAAETLARYEEAEDEEGYASYYLALSEQVTKVHEEYLTLTESQQEKVTNREKLLTYVEMFGVQTLEELSGPGTKPLGGHQVSSYDGEDIQFRMFNYDDGVNENGLSGYFDFRGLYNQGKLNPLTDGDGYGVSRARVKPKLKDGYPVFHIRPEVWDEVENPASADGKSLGYLFGAGGKGVTNYKARNTPLIYYSDNGMFTYDSAENAVDFDTDKKEFILRDYTERGASVASFCTLHENTYSDFFPFTYWNGTDPAESQKNGNYSYNYTSDQIDYWFGMTMEAKFFQPKGGRIRSKVAGIETEGDDMIFRFSGDDDVWVFIDDVLVLDLGGTHGIVSGSINFATGEIKEYLDWGPGTRDPEDYKPTSNIRERFQEAYKNEPAALEKMRWNGDTFADYTEHNLKLFYMERATSCSNCKLEFNLPTLPPNSLMVTKEVTASQGSEGEAADFIKDSLEYKFRVVKEGRTGSNPEDLFIPAGTAYKIWENGSPTDKTGTVGEDGYFTLKSGQGAQFAEMIHTGGAGKYYVEETMPADLTGQYAGVQYHVGSNGGQAATDTEDNVTDRFTTYQSGLLKADESQFVTYFNQVDTNKLGMLKITKEQAAGSRFDPNKLFDMEVKLGGKLLDIGTIYRVTTGTDPQGIERKVEKDGIIQLKIGETATIVKGILSGTEYEIREMIPEGEKIYASYSGTIQNGKDEPVKLNADSFTESAKGEFGLNSTVHVTVTNRSYDDSFKIPIAKTCVGNQETATFGFLVKEVKDFDPSTGSYHETEDALPGTDITVSDDKKTPGEIVIGYNEGFSGEHFYRISEQSGGDGIIYDNNFYIVKVTVANNKAEIAGVWLNGTLKVEKGDALLFTNYKEIPLTVKKIIAGDPGEIATGQSFTFTAQITRDNNPFVLPAPAEGAGYEVDAHGLVKFSLKHGEAVKIPVPVGADVKITEASYDGYHVSYAYSLDGKETKVEGDTASIQGIQSQIEVTVTNTPGILLPDTGGPGLLMFNRYGWMLLLLALMLAGMEVCFYGHGRRKQDGVY